MTRRVAYALLSLALLGMAGSAGYVVRSGDTLGKIASNHDTTIGRIVAANNLADPNLIRIGQVLTIPGSASGGAASSARYEIQSGDTLAAIAARLGVSLSALAVANDIADVNRIRSGDVLEVPSSASQPPAPASAPETTRPPNAVTPARTSHVVAAGETLSGIALQHGVRMATLVQANDIANPNRIRQGDTLVIPHGNLTCPVPEAIFIDDWGFPRPGGRTHEGNDLFAPRGTPVLAPIGGRAEQIDGELGGLQFWLHGADGRTYIGTHLDAFGADGDVGAGAVLGYVGDTGNARGGKTHVHFEILVEGDAINPYPELKAACG